MGVIITSLTILVDTKAQNGVLYIKVSHNVFKSVLTTTAIMSWDIITLAQVAFCW